jgi:phosphate transport system permease protein
MATATVNVGQPGTPDLREPAGWRRAKNQIMTALMVLAFLVILVPLVLVLYLVIDKGYHAISVQFLTNSTIPANVMPLGIGGMGAAIIGTLEITGFAALIAIPLGVLGAVYINEYGGKGVLARVIAFMSDVMTGVPSIVMGLFIYTIWTLHFGYSGMAGSFALACLMLPIVIRSSYEMLRLVPDSLRQGSYALGATKSRVTLTVVLPAASSGIVSGCLLAVARAAGETAPLLFTILTVEATNANLFSGPDTALSTQIFANAQSPYVGAEARAWGAALTLIVIAFVLMILARLATRWSGPVLKVLGWILFVIFTPPAVLITRSLGRR